MARPALNSNAQYGYNYLKKKHNYDDIRAAGVIGTFMQESTMNTGARNKGDGRDGSDSIGIGQWNGARAQGLKRYAAETGRDWTDLDAQLDYSVYEKQNSERRAGQMLSNAKTLDQAADAAISYERPQGWKADNPRAGHGYDNRLNYAKELYSQYSGNNPDDVIGSYTPTAQTAPQEPAIQQAAVAEEKRPFPGLSGSINKGMNAIGFSGEGTDADPRKFMGMELDGDDGLISDLAGISKAFGGGEQQQQQQAPQVSGKAPSAPVEVKFDIASTAPAPKTAEELRRKRLGGLGGFGGFSSFGRA